MSHEITQNDKQQGLTMAWHGLTEIFPVILLAQCWLAQWDVFKRPLWRKVKTGDVNPDGSPILRDEQTDTAEIVATDNDSLVIGKPVDPSYHVLTNKSFLALVQGALDQIQGAIVASVGSVCNRGRIWVTLQVPDIKSVFAAEREFLPYLNFMSSHDKSCGFTVVLSTICTVCNNTFNMNLVGEDGKAFRVYVKHTSGMADRLQDVPGLIAAYFTTIQKFTETMAKLALIPVSELDAKAFFAAFTTEKADDSDKTKAEQSELSTRRRNQIDRLTELFVSGKGNKGQNLADLFSAVTDYYSHENSGQEKTDANEDEARKQRQIASSEFGTGAAMKSYAWSILQDDKKTAGMIAKGHKILAVIPQA
jgi:hypothetical protein